MAEEVGYGAYGAPIDYAKEKWRRKMTTTAPRNWKAHVTNKKDKYARGVAEFIGVSPAQIGKADTWQRAVDAVSEADFARAVAGKEEKWKRNYIEAMTSP